MRRKLSLKKRILFSAIVLMMLYCITEVSSLLACRLVYGHWYTWSIAAKERRGPVAIYSTNNSSSNIPRYIRGTIHPYLGFVEKPGWLAQDRIPFQFVWEEPNVNQAADGFLSRQPIVQRRGQDTVIVGICGGSVARIYYKQGITITLNELREHPEFRGKRFIVVCLAVDGYKQPQQLMALNYVLIQGGQLDVLINIDGFNEVALHAAENAKKNVYPLYPRSWYFRVAQVRDPSLLRLVGKSTLLEERIQTWAACFDSRPLYLSPTCHLIWRARHRSLERRYVSLVERISNREVIGGFDATGPPFEPRSERELYEHLVAIWQRCSQQMHALCSANDIRYFHFLQPNQYLEGSKPMGEEEKRIAIREDHPYRPGAIHGYPLLRQGGSELRRQGVSFTDLTQIFSETIEPVYVDNGCHFGERGNEIMAHEVARTITAEWDRD